VRPSSRPPVTDERSVLLRPAQADSSRLDPLAAKLITSPIYEYYSDYEGPSDYPTGCAYMESKFRPLYRNEAARPLLVHFTCATCVLLPLFGGHLPATTS